MSKNIATNPIAPRIATINTAAEEVAVVALFYKQALEGQAIPETVHSLLGHMARCVDVTIDHPMVREVIAASKKATARHRQDAIEEGFQAVVLAIISAAETALRRDGAEVCLPYWVDGGEEYGTIPCTQAGKCQNCFCPVGRKPDMTPAEAAEALMASIVRKDNDAEIWAAAELAIRAVARTTEPKVVAAAVKVAKAIVTLAEGSPVEDCSWVVNTILRAIRGAGVEFPKPDVRVVLNGGIVQALYSSIPVDASVIDLDVQEEVYQAEIGEQMAALEEAVRAGWLVSSW